MAFVNEYISPEDRERYRLADFEKRLFMINPGPDWAIDRERGIFLRVINPTARKSEPGDPDSGRERDYHFYWKGYNYLVQVRVGLNGYELTSWPGELFEDQSLTAYGSKELKFYVRHLGEWCPLGAVSALKTQKETVIKSFCEVLAFGWGGLFTSLSPADESEPRHAVVKIAPGAEVTA